MEHAAAKSEQQTHTHCVIVYNLRSFQLCFSHLVVMFASWLGWLSLAPIPWLFRDVSRCRSIIFTCWILFDFVFGSHTHTHIVVLGEVAADPVAFSLYIQRNTHASLHECVQSAREWMHSHTGVVCCIVLATLVIIMRLIIFFLHNNEKYFSLDFAAI